MHVIARCGARHHTGTYKKTLIDAQILFCFVCLPGREITGLFQNRNYRSQKNRNGEERVVMFVDC